MLTKANKGFSLVELMVAVAIIAVLASIAIPEFRLMTQNARIKTSAQSLLRGLQLARVEAIKRNLPVEFVLTDGAVDAASVDAVVASANGLNWMVRVQTASGPEYVQGQAANEASLASVEVAGVSAVTFNGFGATTLGAQAQFQITDTEAGECAPNGPIRCVNVQVSPGGQARVCDPAAGDGDNRRC